MSNVRIADLISNTTRSNKMALVVLSIAFVIMMVDVSLARVYDLINKQPTSSLRTLIFSLVICLAIGSQVFLLEFAAKKSDHIRSVGRMHVHTIHNTMRAAQFTIAGILAFLLIQTVFTQSYFTILLISTMWMSYGSSIFVLGLLAKRFLSWYRTHRNCVIALYAISSIAIAANASFTFLYVNDLLADKPMEMKPYSAGSMVLIPPNSTTAFYNSGFFASSIVAFAFLWIATTILLSSRVRRIGRAKFWVIISSPLILFLGQFISYFGHVLDPFLGSDPVVLSLWVTMIFTLSKPVGGILFGIAFYTIARKISRDIALRNYLIMSAVGFVLLFAANQAAVMIVAPFPPFGIASVSFMGFASYLVLLGMYSSAISISQDSALRQLVRKKMEDESGMLETMGTAHMREEIEKKVIRVVKDSSERIMEATGLDHIESEETIRNYVDDVIMELRRTGSIASKGEKSHVDNDTNVGT